MVKLIFLFFYLFVLPTKAYAYLDPGSGSFIFQVFLGTLMGILFSIKLYWQKFKKRKRRKRK